MIAVRENETTPGSAPTLFRGLTHLSDSAGRGLAVKATRTCSVDLCGRPAFARGRCGACYQEWRVKSGDFTLKTWPPRTCDVCSTVFVPHSYQQLRCTAECMRSAERTLQARRVRKFDPQTIRRQRMRKHGITIERYDEILREQGGVCAICGGHNRDGGPLEVDHDHGCCPGLTSCGRCIRGLLCGSCNRALGQLKDNATLLRSAAEYLEARCVEP